MAYLFDANILIRSKNDMPIDIWPTFWNKIKWLIETGNIYTSVKVKEEIDRGDDELTEWLKSNAPESFYIPLDVEIMTKYAETINWARGRNWFQPQAINDFANVADAYLVATASVRDMVLVTYETPDVNCKRRVKIPDACIALGVRYCDFNSVLREIGIVI